MKTCPVCKARTFDDMDVCYGCMHAFGASAGEEGVLQPGTAPELESNGKQGGRTPCAAGSPQPGAASELESASKPDIVPDFDGELSSQLAGVPQVEGSSRSAAVTPFEPVAVVPLSKDGASASPDAALRAGAGWEIRFELTAKDTAVNAVIVRLVPSASAVTASAGLPPSQTGFSDFPGNSSARQTSVSPSNLVASAAVVQAGV